MKGLAVALFLKLETLQMFPSPSTDANPALLYHHCSLIWGGAYRSCCPQESPSQNANIHGGEPILTLKVIIISYCRGIEAQHEDSQKHRNLAMEVLEQRKKPKTWHPCHSTQCCWSEKSCHKLPLYSPETYTVLEETRRQTLAGHTKTAV